MSIAWVSSGMIYIKWSEEKNCLNLMTQVDGCTDNFITTEQLQYNMFYLDGDMYIDIYFHSGLYIKLETDASYSLAFAGYNYGTLSEGYEHIQILTPKAETEAVSSLSLNFGYMGNSLRSEDEWTAYH